jgi:hypothetical protein
MDVVVAIHCCFLARLLYFLDANFRWVRCFLSSRREICLQTKPNRFTMLNLVGDVSHE